MTLLIEFLLFDIRDEFVGNNFVQLSGITDQVFSLKKKLKYWYSTFFSPLIERVRAKILTKKKKIEKLKTL